MKAQLLQSDHVLQTLAFFVPQRRNENVNNLRRKTFGLPARVPQVHARASMASFQAAWAPRSQTNQHANASHNGYNPKANYWHVYVHQGSMKGGQRIPDAGVSDYSP